MTSLNVHTLNVRETAVYSVDQLVRCVIVLEREMDEIVVDTSISICEIYEADSERVVFLACFLYCSCQL